MKINASKPILDFNENPLEKTIGDCIVDALMSSIPGDDKLTASEKITHFKLAMKFHEGGVLDVSVEEVTIIKNRVGIAFPPLVVGRVFQEIGEV